MWQRFLSLSSYNIQHEQCHRQKDIHQKVLIRNLCCYYYFAKLQAVTQWSLNCKQEYFSTMGCGSSTVQESTPVSRCTHFNLPD